MAKLVANSRLREYVQDRLSGQISRRDGITIVGPETGQWTGRNKPHRGDRRWVRAWSPEQIAARLKLDFPDDESMRISHEAIYQALYIQGRGALKRELILCLRTGRALRAPRARSKRTAWAHVTPEALISERPAEVADRAVPGHWEGDLLIGLERSAIGTLVERKTRFTMLIHLPREEGYRHGHRVNNGPALGGYGAIAMKNALAATMSTLPEQLRRSVTWDRGKELIGPRCVQGADRYSRFLRRPALALAARYQRKHQWPSTPILPEGHRPVSVECRGHRSCRPYPQHPTPQDPRLENPRRNSRRTPTLDSTSRCCDHRLNPPSIRV